MAGAAVAGAETSGTAAPQHVEILFQFGWWGLLPVAFCYFWIAGWLVRRVAFTSREARLAGCALIPFFFGFYMQTRGYFFQIFGSALFVLGPLFILSARKPLMASLPTKQDPGPSHGSTLRFRPNRREMFACPDSMTAANVFW
jgi:hypothetical protein